MELRYRQALELPGGTGPSGRRSYKDDDGTLVKRVEIVGTDIAYLVRSWKQADGLYTTALTTPDGRELDRTTDLPGKSPGWQVHRAAHAAMIERLLAASAGRNA
jgi:hypothetical protein